MTTAVGEFEPDDEFDRVLAYLSTRTPEQLAEIDRVSEEVAAALTPPHRRARRRQRRTYSVVDVWPACTRCR